MTLMVRSRPGYQKISTDPGPQNTFSVGYLYIFISAVDIASTDRFSYNLLRCLSLYLGEISIRNDNLLWLQRAFLDKRPFLSSLTW